MHFRNYGLQKKLLHECIIHNNPVAEYPSASNMVNGAKQC